MPKKIAMIPLLLGSTRIKDKNLLLVNGRPLPEYVIEACKEADVFDEIYINSEHEVFREIADKHGIRFFLRAPENGGSACRIKSKSSDCQGKRCQTHDHFIYDFLSKTNCDYMFLAHSTSPLMSPDTIRNFADKMTNDNYDSMFSVVEDCSESFLGGKPLNFNPTVKMPTQNLKPIQRITWALSGWQKQSFMESYARNLSAENGPTFCGRVGLFQINKIEAIDIDNWDDLYLAEAYLAYRHTTKNRKNYYLTKAVKGIDTNLNRLITEDGVTRFEGMKSNQVLSNIDAIKREMGKPPWCYLLVYSDSDQVCLICQNPGEGCRPHYHVTKEEWWVILEGEFEWHLEDRVIHARQNDVVFLKKGTKHRIFCVGSQPGIRLAHGATDMEHIYV
ncbi:MAG: cupin domain-containing protein [Dehalococcoidales bacterium]|jgi:CMP-N-acetylneuraminic acid synthetase/mannose-6-phosphate isomerase-like protein (cupin superfamily)